MSVTELRSVVGLEGKEEPSSQLQASRVKKYSHHRDILIDAITESSDPFISPATTSPCLLNISTDKAASYITQEYLTTCLTSGRELREKFQEECAADEQRFLKPIRRRKVYNFAQENLNKKFFTTKRKSAAESLRDVFVRILVIISEKENFNLRYLMTFPITEYPLSIAHSDGSGLKTNKSKFLEKLEGMQEGFIDRPIPPVSVTLIDGGLLLHSYLAAIGKITSYGNLARNLLSYVCENQGNEIHVLFDTYQLISLKNNERQLHGAEDYPFIISGPEQGP